MQEPCGDAREVVCRVADPGLGHPDGLGLLGAQVLHRAAGGATPCLIDLLREESLWLEGLRAQPTSSDEIC